MSIAKVDKAVYDRLAGDQTLLALCGIHAGAAPDDAALPYLVCYTAGASGAGDGFNFDLEEVAVEVAVYTARPGGLTAADNILDRVYGNAMEDDDLPRTPTFGLHRWTPTLAASGGVVWTGDSLMRVETVPNHDGDAFGYVMRFKMIRSLHPQ